MRIVTGFTRWGFCVATCHCGFEWSLASLSYHLFFDRVKCKWVFNEGRSHSSVLGISALKLSSWLWSRRGWFLNIWPVHSLIGLKRTRTWVKHYRENRATNMRLCRGVLDVALLVLDGQLWTMKDIGKQLTADLSNELWLPKAHKISKCCLLVVGGRESHALKDHSREITKPDQVCQG